MTLFSVYLFQDKTMSYCVIKSGVLIFREKGFWNGFLRTFENVSAGSPWNEGDWESGDTRRDTVKER